MKPTFHARACHRRAQSNAVPADARSELQTRKPPTASHETALSGPQHFAKSLLIMLVTNRRMWISPAEGIRGACALPKSVRTRAVAVTSW